jgi:hypothetical protein
MAWGHDGWMCCNYWPVQTGKGWPLTAPGRHQHRKVNRASRKLVAVWSSSAASHGPNRPTPARGAHLVLVAARQQAQAGGVQAVKPRHLAPLPRDHQPFAQCGQCGALGGRARAGLEGGHPRDEGHCSRTRLRCGERLKPFCCCSCRRRRRCGCLPRCCIARRGRWLRLLAVRSARLGGWHELQQDGQEHGVAGGGVGAGSRRRTAAGRGGAAEGRPASAEGQVPGPGAAAGDRRGLDSSGGGLWRRSSGAWWRRRRRMGLWPSLGWFRPIDCNPTTQPGILHRPTELLEIHVNKNTAQAFLCIPTRISNAHQSN